MLGLSITELAVIVIAAIIFIKPEDIPSLLKQVGVLWRNIKTASDDLLADFQLYDNADSTIKTPQGKPHPAYDVARLKEDTLAGKETPTANHE